MEPDYRPILFLGDIENCKIPKLPYPDVGFYNVGYVIPCLRAFLRQRGYYGRLDIVFVVSDKSRTDRIQDPVRCAIEALEVEVQQTNDDDVTLELRDMEEATSQRADIEIQRMMREWRGNTQTGLVVLCAGDGGYLDELVEIEEENARRNRPPDSPDLETFLLYSFSPNPLLLNYFHLTRKANWDAMLWDFANAQPVGGGGAPDDGGGGGAPGGGGGGGGAPGGGGGEGAPGGGGGGGAPGGGRGGRARGRGGGRARGRGRGRARGRRNHALKEKFDYFHVTDEDENPPTTVRNQPEAVAVTSVLWDIKWFPVPPGFESLRVRPYMKLLLEKHGYSDVHVDILGALSSTGIILYFAAPFAFPRPKSGFFGPFSYSSPEENVIIWISLILAESETLEEDTCSETDESASWFCLMGDHLGGQGFASFSRRLSSVEHEEERFDYLPFDSLEYKDIAREEVENPPSIVRNQPKMATPEEAMAALSVFWDINRFPVPPGFDANLVSLCIKRFLKKYGYSGRLTITALGHLSHVPYYILGALSSTGITLCHAPQESETIEEDTCSETDESASWFCLMGDHLHLRGQGFESFTRHLSSRKHALKIMDLVRSWSLGSDLDPTMVRKQPKRECKKLRT